MNKKIRRLLFELTQNNRITTKKLSKYLKLSQQAASYHVHQLKKKKIVKTFNTVIDPAKLGFISIIVGINLNNFNSLKLKEIIKYLSGKEEIITIQKPLQEVDLLLEFCVKNLSYFNKAYLNIIEDFKGELNTRFILPVIVKHKYPKNYLIKNKKTISDMVFFGDRENITLSNNETKVLNQLIKTPNDNFTKMAKYTNISLKSFLSVKKKLEHLKIVRKYGCIIDHKKLNIERYFLLIKLLNLNSLEIRKILEYCRSNKNIIGLIKVIGEYHIILNIEQIGANNILKEIRSNFDIDNYKILPIESIEKEIYMPLSS